MDHEQHKTKFDDAFGELRRSVQQQDKEKEQQKHSGPVGLDPVKVIKSLPNVLLECLKPRDFAHRQDVLSKMTREEAAQHLDRCIDSGLLVTNTKDAQSDDKEDAITNPDD